MSLREKVFEMYGRKCARCGFSDKRALQLDHVKDDGAILRRSLSGKRRNQCEADWRRAVSKYRPDIYQILCANCNWIKRYESTFPKPWSLIKVKAKAAGV